MPKGRRLLLATVLLGGTALASRPLDLGFTRGVQAVDQPFVSAARCGACHTEQYTQWSGSRHAVAHSNALYTQGLVDEPLAFCVRCHSPLAEQVAEVQPDLVRYAARRHDPDVVIARHPAADEGVTCVVCHKRGDQIVAARDSGRSPHDVLVEPAFATSELCGSCHEFEMFGVHADGLQFTGELMQATYTEWQQWQQSGGREHCQDCHMPDGAHVFRGAHDREWLAQSVQVRARPGRLRLRSVGVGHEHPTGDLFRNITVDVNTGDGFETVHRIGRTFETVLLDGVPTKRLLANTALLPGEWRDVVLPPGPLTWRVRYHYGSEYDEHRQILPVDELVVDIASGSVKR